MAQSVQDGRPIPNTIEHFKFFGEEPLKSEEIDLLCEQINCGETILAESPGEFDVHVFGVVRQKVASVQALSPHEASEKAKEIAIDKTFSKLQFNVYDVEFTGDITHTVVDRLVDGEPDFTGSQTFTD